jgi:hypothetical protein
VPASRCAALCAAVIGLLVTGCGDDKNSSRPGSTTAATTASSAAAPATGRRLQGSGYTLSLARGWHDAKPEGLGADQDLAIADAARDIMTVGRGKVPAGAGSAKNLLAAAFRQELKSVKPTSVKDPAPITVDGRPGSTFEFHYTSPSGVIRVREVYAVDGGYFYNFSLISRPELFDAAAGAFDAMLSSVRWA